MRGWLSSEFLEHKLCLIKYHVLDNISLEAQIQDLIGIVKWSRLVQVTKG